MVNLTGTLVTNHCPCWVKLFYQSSTNDPKVGGLNDAIWCHTLQLLESDNYCTNNI
jgi:hypothetical protein